VSRPVELVPSDGLKPTIRGMVDRSGDSIRCGLLMRLVNV